MSEISSQKIAHFEPQKIAHFEPMEYSQISGWSCDDYLEALNALLWSAKRCNEKVYKTKALNVDAKALNVVLQKMLEKNFKGFKSQLAAKEFFELNFEPYLIVPNGVPEKKSGAFNGFVTAYFEPQIEASKIQTERFKFPILKRPSDLVAITDEERPASMSKEFFFARKIIKDNNILFQTFPNRTKIETGALDEQGLEIFWFESRIDIFFIHIQGSARLILTGENGKKSIERISYDGKSGHVFTPIGKILIERGEIEREKITMQSIRDWLVAHPDKADALMRENESFIFFQKIDHPAPSLGPVAAAGVPLSPNRSLAVDHRLQTFGVPIFISTRDGIGANEKPFQKLMIAQDTGSAIVGAARGDLFIGTGDDAAQIAGAVKHSADFIIFLPRSQISSDDEV